MSNTGEYEWMMISSSNNVDTNHLTGDKYNVETDTCDFDTCDTDTGDRDTALINVGEHDEMTVIGYKKNRFLLTLEILLSFLTCGLVCLLARWMPSRRLFLVASKCSLVDCDTVLLKDQYKQSYVHNVKFLTMTNMIQRRFVNKKVVYIWHQGKFIKLRGIDNVDYSYFHNMSAKSKDHSEIGLKIYGPNFIEIHVTSILMLLFTQILNPFYAFQIFSIILWSYDEYYYYAFCIAIISIISLVMEIYQTRTMERSLKSTISSVMTVFRQNANQEEGEFEEVMADVLVPGDVLMIPRSGCRMSCDAVLISGDCIINESMLTGESVPVTKNAIPDISTKLFNESTRSQTSNHTLFCGTDVVQSRYYGKRDVLAVVVRTGFMTSKGELVRSIMYPKPLDFQFTRDSYKFIGILAGVSMLGMVYNLIIMSTRDQSITELIIRTLDLITIVIPPALPAAMTAGVVFAQRRLKKHDIFCICPSVINICGQVDTACFDKTGTLTEDGLDLKEIIESTGDGFVTHSGDNIDINIAMASCHSLTRIENQLMGDPLDLKMFQASNWILEEPGDDETKYDVFMPTIVKPASKYANFEVGILRQIQFDSREQRMSVIVRRNHQKDVKKVEHPFELFCKGAPEMIASLCQPDTVPKDFHKVLHHYTSRGYRVIALSKRNLEKFTYVKLQRMEREKLEVNLQFLGIMVLENRLKPKTTEIIAELQASSVRCIMITGDNILTALAIGRECGLIPQDHSVVSVHVLDDKTVEWTYADHVTQNETLDIHELENLHFAMMGTSFKLLMKYFPKLMQKIVERGTIFARMSPEQKQQLVEILQAMGKHVVMCGDGANDCGALKTADAGISLSDSEASVAAPFTSKIADISCVPATIREGRAALVASFGIFKFMAGYSLTQFFTVCLLYWINANITDFQFLYIDLFLLTSLCITFGYTKPAKHLTSRLPEISLISIKSLTSVLMQVILMAIFQVASWLIIKRQSWYIPYVENDDDDYACQEVTAIFLITVYQYVIISVVFSQGHPYRLPFYTNYVFLINILICLGFNVYLSFASSGFLLDKLEMVTAPLFSFKMILIAFTGANFIICYIVEETLYSSLCDKFGNFTKTLKHKAGDIEMCLNDEKGYVPLNKSSSEFSDLLNLESSACNTIALNI